MEKREKNGQEPRIIRNRDIPLLSRVLFTMQDVRILEERSDWLSDRMFSITQNLSGMPSAKGGTHGGFDAAIAAIDGLNEEHREQVLSYVRELKTAEKILNSIPSRTMRTFVTMLYVENMSAVAVQRELNMTRRGFENARDAVEQAQDMASVVWRERYYVKK